MDLLFFILICFGCTNILVYGKIFNWIRPKHHFFHCPMCMGFWVGCFFSFFLKIPINVEMPSVLIDMFGVNMFMNDGIKTLACGCLSSGTSYILAMIVGDGGIQIEHKSAKILGKRL